MLIVLRQSIYFYYRIVSHLYILYYLSLLMKLIGKIMKHILWSIFSIIVFVLLVGLAKIDRNVGNYITFLNSHDRATFRWSQAATWTDPFWSNTPSSGNIADVVSSDTISSELSSLDVYDPALEQNSNPIVDISLSGTTSESF